MVRTAAVPMPAPGLGNGVEGRVRMAVGNVFSVFQIAELGGDDDAAGDPYAGGPAAGDGTLRPGEGTEKAAMGTPFTCK